MNRMQYYEKLNQSLKNSYKITAYVEVEHKGEWFSIGINKDYMLPCSHYRICYFIGKTANVISEKAFDKYFLQYLIPDLNYIDFLSVEYKEEDIAISINNLRYVIMSQFEQNFLY